ncbi:MAG: N-terminal phage integrase SAM-like domain-containing protein [Turicibacter sp.]|nr:N-terminal phage integrase SAM-like domain-containing protein [Turicibacter sp.]
MPVYKDEKRGTWYVSCYYKDWEGNRKLKKKRGFERKTTIAKNHILPFFGKLALDEITPIHVRKW